MTRTTLFLLAAAVTLGCSDRNSPTAPWTGNDPQHPIAPSTVEFTGTVVVEETGDHPSVQLQFADGELIPLLGNEAALLARVAGGEVLVRGTLDASPGMVVEQFQVLAMHGRPAIDGVLVETESGLALRLSGGSLRSVSDPEGGFAALIGARLWITGLDEPPVEYGVIDAR